MPSSRATPVIGSSHRLPPGRVFPRSGCRICCRWGWRTQTSLPGTYGQGRPRADTVIGLPAKLFTTTSIPVAILVFDRSREEGGANEDRFDVLFIDASKEFTPGKKQNLMDEAHIAKVVETYRKREVVERYSHVASPDEIADNDYNLNIPRYVDTFEPEEEIDIAEVQRKIDKIEDELVEVRAKMRGYLRELGVEV